MCRAMKIPSFCLCLIILLSLLVGEGRRATGNGRFVWPEEYSYINSKSDSKVQRDKEEKPNKEIIIGSFNLKKFGSPKIANADVLAILVKIAQRYDILAVSEITDRSKKALKKYVGEINKSSPHYYDYVVSPRLGRSNNKEQYAFIYRPSVTLKQHLVYDDSKGDPFAREPFIAIFSPVNSAIDICLTTIHVKPADAPTEIDALYDVDSWIDSELKIKDKVILGDLNADCAYVRKKDWPSVSFQMTSCANSKDSQFQIRLRTSPQYNWLIDDKIDTTVAKSNCAYDRLIISGDSLNKSVAPGSPRPFEFDKVYGLNDSFAFLISDHYPVEFTIKLDNFTDEDKSNLS